MPEFTLTAKPALGAYDRTFDGVRLRELVDLALVSIALPRGGEAAAEQAIEAAFQAGLPVPGKSVLSRDGSQRLLRLGREQLFVLFARDTPDAETCIANRLNGAAYITDQSDVWVGLEMSGANARRALERICPIDLHPTAFAQGSVARTAMEHLGTMIVHSEPDTFVLMSARSSAGSFLHAVETSIRNALTTTPNAGAPPRMQGR